MSPRSDGIQNDLHQDEANAEALRSHNGFVGPVFRTSDGFGAKRLSWY